MRMIAVDSVGLLGVGLELLGINDGAAGAA
jgi:hypothetical protein